jgi:hypothetical protein
MNQAMLDHWLMILHADGYVITTRGPGWQAERNARDAEQAEWTEADRRLWARLIIRNGTVGRR